MKSKKLKEELTAEKKPLKKEKGSAADIENFGKEMFEDK